jgi:hypothetical protein
MSSANPDAATPSLPLECEMCLKEIPASAAFTPEGSEYVGHFCGIACYQAFLRRQREAAASQE